jgi:hypothetical protein
VGNGVWSVRAKRAGKDAFRELTVSVNDPSKKRTVTEKDCRSRSVDISTFLDRELEEEAALELWAHMQDCAACSATYNDMRRVQQAVRAFVVLPGRGNSLVDEIMNRLGKQRRKGDEIPPA